MTFSNRLPHTDVPVLAVQQELTYNSSVRIQDVVLNIYQRRWLIGTDGNVELPWYNYTYTYTCENIINNNDERTHFFRKNIPLTLYSKGLRKGCVWEVSWRLNRMQYWPQVPLIIGATLSHSAGLLSRGSWGPKPSAGSWFSLPRTATRTPTNWLQLTPTVCGTGLYNCLSSTCFLWASQLHRIQPVHGQGILISSTGCTCFLIDGWIEGQYVTERVSESGKSVQAVQEDNDDGDIYIYIYIYIFIALRTYQNHFDGNSYESKLYASFQTTFHWFCIFLWNMKKKYLPNPPRQMFLINGWKCVNHSKWRSQQGNSHCVVSNIQDYNTVVSEFENHSC